MQHPRGIATLAVDLNYRTKDSLTQADVPLSFAVVAKTASPAEIPKSQGTMHCPPQTLWTLYDTSDFDDFAGAQMAV